MGIERCLWSTLIGAIVLGAAARPMPADEQAGIEFFERHIRPVLVQHCYECHSAAAEDVHGGLRLDTRQGIRQGGDTGPAVVPFEVDRSLLVAALRYDEDSFQMPPDQKLDPQIVQHFAQWIEMGAPDPRTTDLAAEEDPPAEVARQRAAEHWAFQRPQIAALPPLSDRTQARNRVDRYVQARLAQNQISPSPLANNRARVRRLYLDLIGIPPTYEQVQAFCRDRSVDAYERLVDQLLLSPRFGERWTRHWLDVARFADTKGYVFQEERRYPHAYQYRDWVIGALNADLPYDQFLQLQIAADQIDGSEQPGNLAAMGFLTLGRRFLNNRHDIIDDRIDVITRGMMGLTVTCARCHDHKYDPIPTADYYSLYGIFASSREPGGEPSPLRLEDAAEPRDAQILVRGNPSNRGERVPRRFLTALSGPESAPYQQGSGRRELARDVASEHNPLTARVIVNRVWGHLLGQHLVDTPSDLGTRSQRPLQQDVLDYLACGLIQHDWSLKWLVREIVLSHTYQQASDERAAARQQDPENRLLWRSNRKRLDFESLRDALLVASGQLDGRQIGGPSEEITGKSPSRRRTLYAFIDRQNLPGLFRVFDFASPDTHAPKRYETTVPQQALYLMNSPFVLEQAEQVVQRAAPREEEPLGQPMTRLYRLVLSRDPTADELQRTADFLIQAPQPSTGSPAPQARADAVDRDRWVQLAQVLLISNEFIFLD